MFTPSASATRRFAFALSAAAAWAALATTGPAASAPIDDQAQPAAEAGEPIDSDPDAVPSEVDEPAADPFLPQTFRLGFLAKANSWSEFTFDATEATVALTLIGSGTSNLDLVLYDDTGVLAIGRSARDFEHITAAVTPFFAPPHVMHVVVFNWGKADNWCTLSSY